jgi:hypothetical protein
LKAIVHLQPRLNPNQALKTEVRKIPEGTRLNCVVERISFQIQQEANSMKLMYRDVPYQSTATQVVLKETPIVAKYRGSAYRLRQAKKNPVLQTSLNLIYRGSAVSSEAIDQQAREALTKQSQQTKQREQSMLMRSDEAIGMPTA